MAPDEYYDKPFNAKHRTGAGGVVARLEAGRVFIALIRDRAPHEWVLPKGGVDMGESLEAAARREIEEEAGFTNLHCLGELGVGERLSGKKRDWQKTHYFLFRTAQIDANPTEHVGWEIKWFGLDDLPPMYWREQAELIVSNRGRIEQLMRG